ncbi:hypothetical protein C4J81_15470 [Deltaproteobacteria bacterium Smac51]|nr:hypothetical protein C4J81_10205 [Deltaproteobacteria bacterium Smac51]UQZ90530.1 hypothetical protein C4J81_15470 [Deltaproteobacteria bacterium Smac51]
MIRACAVCAVNIDDQYMFKIQSRLTKISSGEVIASVTTHCVCPCCVGVIMGEIKTHTVQVTDITYISKELLNDNADNHAA